MNLSARAHKNLQSALAGALLGGLMASPRAGAAAVLNGLTAFTQGVLPFLFPFSCLAQLLACGRRAPLWALRLTGMLGGSPTGARLLAEVGDERAARRSAMMTGGVSPMFFAGTLALWLDSRADGTILLASHLGALALGGLLLPRGQARDIQTPEVSLPQAVAQSALAMLSVGGCIAMGALAAALTGAFLPDVPRALLHAALEMSGGCPGGNFPCLAARAYAVPDIGGLRVFGRGDPVSERGLLARGGDIGCPAGGLRGHSRRIERGADICDDMHLPSHENCGIIRKIKNGEVSPWRLRICICIPSTACWTARAASKSCPR